MIGSSLEKLTRHVAESQLGVNMCVQTLRESHFERIPGSALDYIKGFFKLMM